MEYATGLPSPTARAPSASALKMSVPAPAVKDLRATALPGRGVARGGKVVVVGSGRTHPA